MSTERVLAEILTRILEASEFPFPGSPVFPPPFISMYAAALPSSADKCL